VSYSKRTFERNLVSLNAVDGLLSNNGLAILQARGNIDWLPFNWGLYYSSEAVHIIVLGSPTLAAAKMSLTDWEISGPIPSPSIKLTV